MILEADIPIAAIIVAAMTTIIIVAATLSVTGMRNAGLSASVSALKKSAVV